MNVENNVWTTSICSKWWENPLGTLYIDDKNIIMYHTAGGTKIWNHGRVERGIWCITHALVDATLHPPPFRICNSTKTFGSELRLHLTSYIYRYFITSITTWQKRGFFVKMIYHRNFLSSNIYWKAYLNNSHTPRRKHSTIPNTKATKWELFAGRSARTRLRANRALTSKIWITIKLRFCCVGWSCTLDSRYKEVSKYSIINIMKILSISPHIHAKLCALPHKISFMEILSYRITYVHPSWEADESVRSLLSEEGAVHVNVPPWLVERNTDCNSHSQPTNVHTTVSVMQEVAHD